MQAYYDVVVNTGNDPVANASVFVYDATGALATIYDSSVPVAAEVLASNGTPYFLSPLLVVPQANPITTGLDGRYLFFAANGIYTVVITANGYNTKTLTVSLNDPSDAPGITYTTYTTAPNNLVNAASLQPKVSTASGDLALVPKGQGALLGQVPTSTIAGGNKRGLYAVDFQRLRTLADEVASGSFSSVLAGYGNKASDTGAIVAGGQFNYATGANASVLGGTSHVASGFAAAVGGGQNNTASGIRSTVSGGFNNTASGPYSAVVGGSYGTAKNIAGYVSIPASAFPIQTVAGASQSGVLVLAVQTTDATPTTLRSNSDAASATNQFILLDNSGALLNIDLIGTDGTDYFTINAVGIPVIRGAGAATTFMQVGYYTPTLSAGASTWAWSIVADTTYGGVRIQVTGQVGKTIKWVARVFSTEVKF